VRVRRRVLGAAAVAALALTVPAAAVGPVSTSAAVPVTGGALGAAHPVLTWHGQMHNPVPVPMASDPDPSVCAVDCQLWTLKVATASPFLVSVHNTTTSIDDGFNLYVYDPAGTQVGSSSGIGSDGQAAVVHPTGPGDYTVAVTMTYAFDTDASYLGEARLMTAPTWDPVRCARGRVCPLLPVLKPLPPSDVHVDGVPPVASTPLGFPFPVDVPTGFSCYLDEIAQHGVTRCLRFTSEVDNVGTGRLQLQVPWLAASGIGMVPGMCHAEQVITYTDGSTRTRPAGDCEWHATHAHFHYLNYVEFSLHEVTPDGRTGKQVAASLKESFCLADDGYFGFGTAGPNGPRTYVGQPGCNVPGPPSASSPEAWVTMGNSPGWGDIYTWDTPDQYIDISTMPAGVYDIESRANPHGALLLGKGAQLCAATRIQLTDTSVTTLRRGIPCR
jgi:hypothetical protein